jgi:hypothetical protein
MSRVSERLDVAHVTLSLSHSAHLTLSLSLTPFQEMSDKYTDVVFIKVDVDELEVSLNLFIFIF